MKQSFAPVRSASLLTCSLLCLAAAAQKPLGTLKTEGVEITGSVSVGGGNATIGNSAAVAAGAQPSQISLERGGMVRLCSGSSMHLSQSTLAVKRPPLMLALDRGSVEIKTAAEKTDAILTPDLRFELSDAAPLDLHIRVVPSGDTCVENAGKDAPVLHVTETFGTGAYFIRPGQRVLFEHGSLREVVDHESSSCGCPRPDALVLAGKGKQGNGKVPEAVRANPFPEAVSQGLQRPEVPQAAPDQTHVQVATTLNYSGETNSVTGPPGQTTAASAGSGATNAAAGAAEAANAPPATASAPSPAGSTATTSRPAPPAEASAHDVHIVEAAAPQAGPNPFRAIGHFFRRLFGGR